MSAFAFSQKNLKANETNIAFYKKQKEVILGFPGGKTKCEVVQILRKDNEDRPPSKRLESSVTRVIANS